MNPYIKRFRQSILDAQTPEDASSSLSALMNLASGNSADNAFPALDALVDGALENDALKSDISDRMVKALNEGKTPKGSKPYIAAALYEIEVTNVPEPTA